MATVIKPNYFGFYSHLPALSCSTPLNGHALCCCSQHGFETLLEPKALRKNHLHSYYIILNCEALISLNKKHLTSSIQLITIAIAWYFFQICPKKNSFFIAPQLGSGHHQLDLREMLSRHIGEGTQATAPFEVDSNGFMVPRVGGSVELTRRHEVRMHSIYIYIFTIYMYIYKYKYIYIYKCKHHVHTHTYIW